VSEDFFHKRPDQNDHRKFKYHLTDKGRARYGFALALWHWELSWNAISGSSVIPTLTHHTGERPHTLQIKTVCKHCKEGLSFDDISLTYVPVADGDTQDTRDKANHRRQVIPKQGRTLLAESASIMGDRWTPLILKCVFTGIQRFDDLKNILSIATNILSDRLKFLKSLGLIIKHHHPVTNIPEYSVTEKGKSLFPSNMLLRQWAIEYLPGQGHPYDLVHTSCKHSLHAVVICTECGEEPIPSDVVIHTTKMTNADSGHK
jgi:DNA-binding HxlR family transcriptional regulator